MTLTSAYGTIAARDNLHRLARPEPHRIGEEACETWMSRGRSQLPKIGGDGAMVTEHRAQPA